ncbi:hypothetical protein [Spongiactinospora gelatinilytica]|uniref:hypothetical protein n=1 Tax=Spongiactinospora gelatinilytica TaxID=2666298 RepID=UPI001F207365|nr:hypothetical protein [Spongiactinospora gelatinilytica]
MAADVAPVVEPGPQDVELERVQQEETTVSAPGRGSAISPESRSTAARNSGWRPSVAGR